MKHLSVMHAAIAAFVWLALLGAATDAPCASQIRWYPYEEGIALGQSDGKKTFINFYADWCKYCQTMEQKTFKDPTIVSYLNENFISIRVDVDREKQVAAKYNINPLPDTWFVSEAGEIIGNKPGYMTAEQLLPVLQFIHTDSFLKMSFAEFMKAFRKSRIE